MSDRLPDLFDPRRFAEQGRVLRGDVPLAAMRRLGSSLSSGNGVASVDLTFGIDTLGVKYVAGTIRATLSLTCQRCMHLLELPVEARVSLGVVDSEAQAQRLPDGYEPLLVESGRAALSAVVEDELILALPIVPLHPPGACEAAGKAEMANEASEGSEPDSPFAVLARLKRPPG
jgi:DUF177 domain-containing protein